jgi:phage-related protein
MSYKKHWRDYQTEFGARPVKESLRKLSKDERVEVAAGMADVLENGLEAARHLRGDIYEVRVDGPNRSYRLLFSSEGHFGCVLLALHVFEKRTQKTPPKELALAEARLADWRACGAGKQRRGRTRPRNVVQS